MRRGIRPTLKHLNPSGRFPSGNTRYYYRPKGQKGIAMPDLPIDHPGFLAAYVEASGTRPRAPVRSGSIASALALYKASDDFKRLAAGTRNARRPMLDDIAERYGFANAGELAPRHVKADLDRLTGHARNNRLKAWRSFGKWLASEGIVATDPTDGARRAVTAKTDGHEPWQSEDVAAFRVCWPIGSMQRVAFELIFWTGARVSDAIRLGEKDVDRDGWLIFRQQKTGGEVAIPYRRELPNFAERFAGDLTMLHDAIAAIPERHMTWIFTRRGASRSSKAVSQWFAAQARRAGIEGKTAHGLRKSRAIAFAEAGATSTQIGAWTGHESLKEIERYIRKFDKRRALSKTDPEQKVPTPAIKFQKGG